MVEVLRQIVRRAVVLLELGTFAPVATPNVQAKITVEVSYLEHARPIAGFDVPHHAAGLPVTACPLLDNRPAGLCAVADVQAQVGIKVPDQVARGTVGDTAPTRKHPWSLKAT